MVILNIKEAYNDHPDFLNQVLNIQQSILSNWQEISTWVNSYRDIIDAMKEFQQKTQAMSHKFIALRNGIHKDGLDLSLIEKLSKSIELIFNMHISQLSVMDTEVIVPVLNMKSRIQEDLEVKMQKYQLQKGELYQKKMNFIGLNKIWMEPSLAIQLVEESHELYNLKLQKVQTHLNWINYLNQLQSNSELWWYHKLIVFMNRFTRWHSNCLTTLRSTESNLVDLEEHLNNFTDVINLDIPPNQNQIAEELFSRKFQKYKKELGLINNIENSSLHLDDYEEEMNIFGELNYYLNKDTDDKNMAFFEINNKAQFIAYDIKNKNIINWFKEPLDLCNCTINEIEHPKKNHILRLNICNEDKFELYLQCETFESKKQWLECFLKYIPQNNFKLQKDNIQNNKINNENFIIKDNLSEMMNKININVMESYEENSSTKSSIIKLPLEEKIVKVGKAYLREYKNNKNKDILNNHPSTLGYWKPILLNLSSFGYLCLYSEMDKNLIYKIEIKEIYRFNIGKLDDSYFNEKSGFMININEEEIYYFKVENFMERDIWICLLKSLAQPEIFGKLIPLPKLYRIYRSFWLRILDGKNLRTNESIYCQIYLDDKLSCFTSIKNKTFNPFWREDFILDDLKSFKEGITINLMSYHKFSKDHPLAYSFIPVKSIRPGEFYEGWYPLMEGDNNPIIKLKNIINQNNININQNNNINDNNINNKKSSGFFNNNNNSKSLLLNQIPVNFNYHGDLRLKLRYDEVIILKSSEYFNLMDLIMDLENNLIYDIILNNQHLDWLSETFLKIYCSQNKAIDLLNYLALKEVENTEDANILFRGNSILTKTIDAYMKMVGLQYLEDTIGNIIREVCNNKIICEVDSNKLDKPEDVKNQWKILFSFCERLWFNIQISKHLCPRELRLFFFNLRKLISDKYQNQPELLLMTRYTCVSGFLFLRLFCPAVLSPKLFGLVKEHPDPKTHRTLTLLAKSLQCLANLADFGVKEPYMAQMNGFIMDNMNNLMDFIDYIASEPTSDIQAVQQAYNLPEHPSGFLGPIPPFTIDLDRELSFLSGFITRYSNEFKIKIQKDKEKVELRHSKPGKLERLLSICNAIDFMVKDCLKAGSMQINWKLIH